MNHIKEEQDRIKNNILKSYVSEPLEKGGKRAEIGEVRTWDGVKVVKHADGWVILNQKTNIHTLEKPGGKRVPASDHHIEHAKEALKKHENSTGTAGGKVGDREDLKPTELYQKKNTFNISNVVHISLNGDVHNAWKRTINQLVQDHYGLDEEEAQSIVDKHSYELDVDFHEDQPPSKALTTIIEGENIGTSPLMSPTKEEPGVEKDKKLDKYKTLTDREKLEVNGVTYKLNLIKHPKEPYNFESYPSFSVKITHPVTGEISVIPNAIRFHTGYDQGWNASNKQQYYPNVAGYGTSNGGGYSSPSEPYLSEREKEHLASIFSGVKSEYNEVKNKHQDSIRTYPKGTKNEEIKRDVSGY